MKLKRLSEVTLEDMKNFPEPRDLTPEERAEVLRLARESFTAADLAQFADLDEGVPLEEFIADLEARAQEFHRTKPGEQAQS